MIFPVTLLIPGIAALTPTGPIPGTTPGAAVFLVVMHVVSWAPGSGDRSHNGRFFCAMRTLSVRLQARSSRLRSRSGSARTPPTGAGCLRCSRWRRPRMMQAGGELAAVSLQTHFGVTEGSESYAEALPQLRTARSFEYDNQLVGREGVEPPQLSRRFYIWRPPDGGAKSADLSSKGQPTVCDWSRTDIPLESAVGVKIGVRSDRLRRFRPEAMTPTSGSRRGP